METVLIIAIGIAALIATGYYFSSSEGDPEEIESGGGGGAASGPSDKRNPSQ
jgi:hypothetical protein